MKEKKVLREGTVKPHTIAVILAAGQGKRMNSQIQKQYMLLKGRPVLFYSMKAFQESMIDEIILVTGVGETDYVRREIVEKYGFTKVCAIVEGGRERYHSVYEGLKAAVKGWDGQNHPVTEDTAHKKIQAKEGNCPQYVFIHDGARPFVDKHIISRTYESAVQNKACVAAMPVKDTIKIADEGGFAAETLKRSLVWMIQTPQVFELGLILGAYSELLQKESALLAAGEQITDDAWVVERFTDTKVKLVEGSYENIKITTPEDIRMGEALI